MPKPYERLKTDSDRGWAAFQIYRDLPPEERLLQTVADRMGVSISMANQWSAKGRWAVRAKAWDAAVDTRRRNVELKAVEDMRRRQMQLALSMQNLGGMELRKLLIQAQKEQKISTVSAELILKLIDQGAKLERLNRGEPGEIVQVQSDADLDFSRLSTEELRNLRDIRRKLTSSSETVDDGEA